MTWLLRGLLPAKQSLFIDRKVLDIRGTNNSRTNQGQDVNLFTFIAFIY